MQLFGKVRFSDMLLVQSRCRREAGCGRARHAANVAALIGFGKARAGARQTRRRRGRERRGARAPQPCLGKFAQL